MARRRPRRQLKPAAAGASLLLDAEALSRAARGDVRMRAHLQLAWEERATVHVSSVTLTEVLRGGPRDAPVHALLNQIDQRPVTPALGRAAGELLGRTRRPDAMDAIIVVTAAALGGRVAILTGDPVDLRALSEEIAGISVIPL